MARVVAPRVLYAITCIEREKGEPDRQVYWRVDTERAYFDDRARATLFESSKALDELRAARLYYSGRRIWLVEVTIRKRPRRKTIAELVPHVDETEASLTRAVESYKVAKNYDTQTKLRRAAEAFVTLWREWDEARQ